MEEKMEKMVVFRDCDGRLTCAPEEMVPEDSIRLATDMVPMGTRSMAVLGKIAGWPITHPQELCPIAETTHQPVVTGGQYAVYRCECGYNHWAGYWRDLCP